MTHPSKPTGNSSAANLKKMKPQQGLFILLILGISAIVFAQQPGNSQPGVSSTSSPTSSPMSSPTSTGGASGQATSRQVYVVQLNPANPSLSSANGVARIVVDSGNFGIIVQASGVSPNMMHLQHIHPGTSCPGL